MNQQTCNSAWLDAFLKNDLNASQEQIFTSHLDECSDCREELENRAAEQSVWREASNLLGGSNLLSTAALGDVRSGTVRSPQIELVLKQLAPTDDPESLGRIGGYEVTGVVGAGGMGVVLKAHDRSLDRIVAIKVMSPHLASSGSARKRFAREAKAAAAVLHPNVIAIHSVASEDACPYLVMPYLRGASLQKRIDNEGPLPLKDTLRIGAQIAAGLAAAHEQGLVHRDIKPANILLEEGVERVTITDFGLARTVDDASMTCSGVIAGTPQYMSPEQTRGELIDARSDLFSLGSVLYAMCAGRSPFRAETTYGVLHRIANDNPTPVCEVNSDIPEWLGRIIERLMAKRSEDRFESASQVAELLEGCLAHVQQPAVIPLPDAVATLAPIKTRRPPIGKFIAAAAFAFALVFAGVFIVLELNKGTLTIQSDADDIRVRITSSGEVINELKVTKSGKSVRVAAGQYKVEVIGETDDLTVENGQLTLHRAGTEVVRIVHQAKTPSEKQTISKNLNADEWWDKLQGNWKVVQQYVENGVPKRNSYSATVRRNRMEIIPDDGQHSMMFDFVLGEAGPPQQIDLKVVVSDLERQEMLQVFRDINEPPPEAVLNPIFNGIVEFEGNTLRICNHEVPNSPRPIQFTDSSDRVIWNFTRSDRDLSVVPSNDGRLLSEAIRQFNEHQKSDPIGSKQPPLTDDEVIAAVRAMRQEIKDLDISESEYRRLLAAIEHRQIPKEWTIASNNRFQLSDGRVGERWVVQLVLQRSDSSTRTSVFRSRYVRLVSEDPKSALPMPEGHVSIAHWLAKVNEPDLNIYTQLPDSPVTEQEIIAALSDLIDKEQSEEFAPQKKTLQEIIATRSMPKRAELTLFRPHLLRGYVSRWANSKGFDHQDWTLRLEYPYTIGEKQEVTASIIGFRPIESRPIDHVTEEEIHWGPAAADGLQFGVAMEESSLPEDSNLASQRAVAYRPHFYFRNPGATKPTSIQLSNLYQHYEIDARTATGEPLPSKRRQGSYHISTMIFPDPLDGESRIYKRACPFVVGAYAQAFFEDSLSLEPAENQSFENFPSLAVNAPPNTPLRIRISIPHPVLQDSTRLMSGEVRLPPLTLESANAEPAEDEKAKDEAAKAWLRRPVVGSTHDGKSFQLAGHDALMHCVMTNNFEALNRLLTVDKYDLDFCPRNGQWTLLQIALQHNCLETTSLLLRHGANPNFASEGTPLPLELAQRSGRKELVALVQKYLESVAPHPQTKVSDAEDERSPIQKTADSLVTITFAGTIDGASVTASGIGWRVDDSGHILVPSNVVAECDDESIQLRFASGVRCSATRLKTLGHLTLLKSDQVVNGPAISLNSETSLTSGDAVSAILNGTDNVPGSIVKPRTTIAYSELDGVKFNPELRIQNIITTDFVADDTTLSGAPLLTKDGDVAGMIIRLGSAQLIAIPVTEIREVLKQHQQVANSGPIRDHGLSTESIETRTDGRFGILKIIEPTSLEDAVTKFNLLAKEHPLGRTQPELTVQEMTAAFRLWIASDECNEATRKDFQQVLDTQMLRPSHILQFNTEFETDGHLFEVWSIPFGDDKSSAWFKIRDTKLLSRLKTDEERNAWEQRIDQMKKSFREYKRWGDRPKAYDTNPADNEPKDATKDSAVTLPPIEFDTLKIKQFDGER